MGRPLERYDPRAAQGVEVLLLPRVPRTGHGAVDRLQQASVGFVQCRGSRSHYDGRRRRVHDLAGGVQRRQCKGPAGVKAGQVDRNPQVRRRSAALARQDQPGRGGRGRTERSNVAPYLRKLHSLPDAGDALVGRGGTSIPQCPRADARRQGLTVSDQTAALPGSGLRSRMGVRTRLLRQFSGSSGLGIRGRAAALYSFREMADVLDRITQRRIPAALSSQALSRHAERIAAAAPALLNVGNANDKQDRVGEIAWESVTLNRLMAEVKRGSTESAALGSLEQDIGQLRTNLTELESLVNDRLRAAEQKKEMLRQALQIGSGLEDLLTPWIAVMDGKIGQWRRIVGDPNITNEQRKAADQDFEKSLAGFRTLQTLQVLASTVNDQLQRGATAEVIGGLGVSRFRLTQSMSELERVSAGVDPKLRELLKDSSARLAWLLNGDHSIFNLRQRELTLIADGSRVVAENSELSKRLTVTVDSLVDTASKDISAANEEASAIVRLSTLVVVVAVVWSLLSSFP